ncbi:fructoselysine 6-kinase [Paenibacillus sp. P26]|nr:fructoselysine 6-kinase [Paenibacillus sp. P26]UUZ95193.1 fructoselysine 6-kinase [Paenibacillus sp. P25]
MTFIAIGDNCIDDYIDSNRKFPGGNALNFAVYTKELGAPSAYFGFVGSDDNGRIILGSLDHKGLDVSRVRVVKGRTAVTKVELKNGERIFGDYDEGVFSNFSITAEELAYIKQHRYIHSAVWGKCEPYLEELHRHGAILSFDFATKQDPHYMQEICKNIDYAFISYTNDDLEIRRLLQTLTSYGPKAAVATLGEKGSIAFDGQTFHVQPSHKVNVIDTMGAGDSFIAGFMVAVSQGKSIPCCLKSGTDKASQTIQYFGAW